jgi:SSS family solute:Na+ symporter
VVTGIWFTWGGLRDMRRLFSRLRTQRINALDDGTVIGHRNLDELADKRVGGIALVPREPQMRDI